ncbi:MAG: DUF2017 family protein [Actinobacteria bacterium]|nr:DUF2017 family protein [Actinomycetota bacterium]MCZ6518649.1 DUF2017 family protein [Actinomycetota bacterium]MCZ6568037.1 DUF2017 family protein [Actinomycetota bacterium]MCZ6740222.1 DUF2017 family protein [Actinomycetota bacterium]
MSHFKTTSKGIRASFSPEERAFLADVLPLLAGIGEVGVDPAATRLNVPVYLDDPGANEEWWRLMGLDLDAARQSDRDVLRKVVQSDDSTVLSDEEADSLLRVLNEARLTLGARLGLEVEEDHERLEEDGRRALDYLGWVLEELTVELTRSL